MRELVVVKVNGARKGYHRELLYFPTYLEAREYLVEMEQDQSSDDELDVENLELMWIEVHHESYHSDVYPDGEVYIKHFERSVPEYVVLHAKEPTILHENGEPISCIDLLRKVHPNKSFVSVTDWTNFLIPESGDPA